MWMQMFGHKWKISCKHSHKQTHTHTQTHTHMHAHVRMKKALASFLNYDITFDQIMIIPVTELLVYFSN